MVAISVCFLDVEVFQALKKIRIAHGDIIYEIVLIIGQHQQGDAFVDADDIAGFPFFGQIIGIDEAVSAKQFLDIVVIQHGCLDFIRHKHDRADGSGRRDRIIDRMGTIVIA